MSRKPNLIIVVGPTASGKSELAVKLARQFKGEIISADSRQVYRGLDIGTAKVPGKWMRCLKYTLERIFWTNTKGRFFIYHDIPHHCIDFVSPRRIYTVAKYKKCAEEAIRDITARGKIPIIVGGTGFWIDAVVYNLSLPEVPPDSVLRKKLKKKTPAQLYEMLQRLDPARAKTIEQKNPRRLIRAIEIAKTLGRIPIVSKKRSPYRALWIGLKPSYEVQPRKITDRARRMIRRGILQETKKLLSSGVSKKRMREFGFEYRAVLSYLAKEISRKEMLGRIIKDTLHYARRQMTWWERNQNISWIISSSDAVERVRIFLKNAEL